MSDDIVSGSINSDALRSNTAITNHTVDDASGGIHALLIIPVVLFLGSLFIPPIMIFDTAAGFFAFRGFLNGGPFNYVIMPDPQNIAHNSSQFLAWWSPGQYLVPGVFVWLGTNYGLAMSLTTLLATVLGVLGWVQIARSVEVSRYVLRLFVFGLVTFRYATAPFSLFNGGEEVLFAVLPWSFSVLQWSIQKPPAGAFLAALLVAGVLFFAKLSGLLIFAATVGAIGVLDIIDRKRLTPTLLAMWASCAVGALLFVVFWLDRGSTPASAIKDAFAWPDVWFPVAAAAFSGFSAISLVQDIYILGWRVVAHTPIPNLSAPTVLGYAGYVLGPLGLCLMVWVWVRLRATHFRAFARRLFAIIACYIVIYIAMYIHSNTILFEERYFYFAGILCFLLVLITLDQLRLRSGRIVATLLVGLFAVYGLTAHAHELMRNRLYDEASGATMLVTPPSVLAYLRSEMAMHHWRNAIAVVPQPEAALGLPRYRILFSFDLMDSTPLEQIARQRWMGRTDKIFVIMNKEALADGKADAVLKTFVDYDFENWRQVQLSSMVVFSQ